MARDSRVRIMHMQGPTKYVGLDRTESESEIDLENPTMKCIRTNTYAGVHGWNLGTPVPRFPVRRFLGTKAGIDGAK